MKPIQTLVLLANEKEARLLVNEGVGKGLRQIRDIRRADFPDAEVAYADQPGRAQAAPGAARHGVAPSTSEQRQMRERFVAHVVGEVGGVWSKGGYDRLIVSAPAKTLGALRDAMPAALAAALTADLDKDLIHTPLAELPKHFESVAAF